MASWSEWSAELLQLVNGIQQTGGNFLKISHWFDEKLTEQLDNIAKIRKRDTVIFYASAFLQKPSSPHIPIMHEDINGFMNALYKAPADKGLTLILHTPGGDPNAVESIVEYLHAKFTNIEVIVPYMAMSGGAMMSLASNLVVLGHHSQLGPIDPQLTTGGETHSARAIQEGFEQAKVDIMGNPQLGHLWAPILQGMGASLVTQSGKELAYSKELVQKWLSTRMFSGDERAEKIAHDISAYFNAEKIKNDRIHVHGQRIDIQKLKQLGVKVEQLEDEKGLQTATLNAYHLMTLIFEQTNAVKLIVGNKGAKWTRNDSEQQIQ